MPALSVYITSLELLYFSAYSSHANYSETCNQTINHSEISTILLTSCFPVHRHIKVPIPCNRLAYARNFIRHCSTNHYFHYIEFQKLNTREKEHVLLSETIFHA